MLRGWPSPSKRSPTALSTASGQPSAEEDETVTIAPSGMRRAASEAEITFCRDIFASYSQVDGGGRAGARRFARRKSNAQRFDAVFTRRRGRASALNGGLKKANRTHVELFLIELEQLLAGA